MKKWLNVQNKYTYLFLLTIPIGILKMILMGFRLGFNLPEFVSSLVIMNIGVYFFVRFNTYSHFYNPDHPKPKS